MAIKFNNNSNKIRIQNDCLFFNYNPKKGKPENALSLALSGNSKSDVNFSLGNVQSKLLRALAGGEYYDYCDAPDDDTILTEQDLKRAKERFGTEYDVFKGLNVKSFIYDERAGIANIETNSGDVLWVDLHTEYEKQNGLNSRDNSIKTSTPANTNSCGIQNTQNAKLPESQEVQTKISAEKQNSQTSNKSGLPRLYNRKLNQIANTMKISREELDKKIANAAKQTGYSEYFISHIVSMENYEAKVRNTGDGTITGGFGHSGLSDKSIKEGDPVKPNLAFKWLVSDIKKFENIIKNMKIDSATNETIGQYYDKLPMSIREALIDVAFNRDAKLLGDTDCETRKKASPKELEKMNEYKYLRANIKAGTENLPAVAARLCQRFDKYSFKQKLEQKFTTGLMERNVYRFLLAIRDLDSNYKVAAKRRFTAEQKEGYNYFTEAISLKKAKNLHEDAKYMQETWDAMK